MGQLSRQRKNHTVARSHDTTRDETRRDETRRDDTTRRDTARRGATRRDATQRNAVCTHARTTDGGRITGCEFSQYRARRCRLAACSNEG
ncbi:hypothetical protein PUN28_001566 [Cardiocondyla obscurior]|uniref:Uncharacterized protein n=1 Tax=Cardiocondyla obscurior TaxID=286306 RepID=A0AAW2H5Z0_9HYME